MADAKKIVVGLGNPGSEYEATYHNAGMLALRALAAALEGNGEEIIFKPHRDLFLYARGENGGLALVIPLLYMNESGNAAKEALKKFGASPRDMIVMHDDSDLKVGSYKIAAGRGAAGHHGVESIIRTIGSGEFTRVRIGIRPPAEKTRKKAGEFVLKKISAKDRRMFEKEVFPHIAAELL